jgi:flagellar protein FlaG
MTSLLAKVGLLQCPSHFAPGFSRHSSPKRGNLEFMSPSAQQPQMNLVQTDDFRESYANSVQVRVSVWDFQLVFGLASSDSPDQITIRNQNAIYLSPQQAKALWNMLGQNLAQYERAFGTLNLEPQSHSFPAGPVN